MEPRAERQAVVVPNLLSEVYEKYYQQHRRAVSRRTYRRLSRYRLTAIQQVAEDLCQETFHSVYRWMCNFWKEHHQHPSEAIFERVLKTIEINEYRTHMKRAKYPIHEAELLLGESGALEELLPSSDPSPEDELLWKEYEERIQHCLKKLKSTERSALLLKLIGHSDKEVANLLGETPKKVMFSIIPLGRRKLRKCMMSYVNGYRQ